MGNRRSVERWAVALWISAIATGAARAAAEDVAGVGVLDRLTVPPVTAGERPDGRAVGPQLSADAIAVPTPTAASSGLVVLGGLMMWRAGRRAIGRT